MKRVLLVSLGLIAMATYAGGCLPEEGGVTGVGGTPGTAGTSPQGVAGTTGTGNNGVAGTSGEAGTTGQAGDSGSTAGTGGSTPTPGAAGAAGSAQAGAGGGVAGAGGNLGRGGMSGSQAGAGGAVAGAGGNVGRGGTGGSTAGTGGGGTTGSAGRGGTTGTAGTGGAVIPTIPELFPTSGSIGSLDGRLLTMPCLDDNTAGTDCGGGGGYYSTAGSTTATRIQCSGGNLTVNQVFYVGGETGRMYNVRIHVYGVSEPKNYGTGVTREAGTARPALTPTGAGAVPTPWGTAAGNHTYPVSDYNTNEIRVCRTRACAATDETNVYYLNADTQEGHWTYVLNYEKDIVVVGGGSVRVRNYDRNCREIKNCGPSGTAANQCAATANARIVSTTAAMPAPASGPAASGGLLQPNLDPARPAGSSGQWLLLDVVRINSVQ